MLLSNEDVLNVLGKSLKAARKNLKYTQEFVAENVDISIDFLRNIENGKNIGSVTTLLNLCNFLKISPNSLFGSLLDFKKDTLDTYLIQKFNQLCSKDKKIFTDIIIHLDRNY